MGNISQNETIQYTFVTAEPNGYGDDLAAWSNHATKLTAIFEATTRLTLNGSLVTYWEYPGSRDITKYNTYGRPGNQSQFLDIYEGHDDIFGPSAFLNLGIHYKIFKSFEIRGDMYNVLGWLDKDLNKRNFQAGMVGSYRAEAPAVGLSVRYSF